MADRRRNVAGFESLLERRAIGLGDITSDNVIAQSVSQAELRAKIAEAHLGADIAGHAPTPLPPAASGEHPPPVVTTDHPAPAPAHDPLVGGEPAHAPAPVVVEHSGPEFNVPNPLEVMSPELRALSEQHLTGSGETVLGPFEPPGGGPSYISVAEQHGASYFDIGQEAWNAATPIERLAANQHALDMAIQNGDKITLSVPARMIPEDSYTAAEIRYLEAHGYQRNGPNTLVPPRRGVR